MESTEPTVPIPVRLDIDAVAPHFSRALAHLDNAMIKELDAVGFDPRLRELVRLRASQINSCTYCVHSHTASARAKGLTPQQHAELLAVIGLATHTNALANALQVPVDPEFEVR